jgi:hypothetical protein
LFFVHQNALTGSRPSFAGLNGLQNFEADHNMLTGTIPSLNDASNFQFFDVSDNALNGTAPTLIGLRFSRVRCGEQSVERPTARTHDKATPIFGAFLRSDIETTTEALYALVRMR